MKAFVKSIIVPLMVMACLHTVHAQIGPKTISVGITVDYYHNKERTDPTYQKSINIQPDLQYFYKENRAVVGGVLFNRFEYTYRGSYNGRLALYKANDQMAGGFLGIRNLYPIKEKLYFYIDLGMMYYQSNSQQVITDNPDSSLDIDYERRSYTVRGYASLGLMYFLNQKFSLESNLLNAGVSYSSPLGDPSVKVHNWNVDMNGGFQYLSFGLRYYF